ncbi:hypothetical protein BV898_15030 [Hypsibius exemplaris]|uniref:Uncharacterized protein n=1 Tax=Hypsibius exemplaris TaxID=2072580 RepID=A0A9X6NA04_HYPEX|nr:hypothetical protein BV898_15030 [Hypsibius exemplaris]
MASQKAQSDPVNRHAAQRIRLPVRTDVDVITIEDDDEAEDVAYAIRESLKDAAKKSDHSGASTSKVDLADDSAADFLHVQTQLVSDSEIADLEEQASLDPQTEPVSSGSGETPHVEPTGAAKADEPTDAAEADEPTDAAEADEPTDAAEVDDPTDAAEVDDDDDEEDEPQTEDGIPLSAIAQLSDTDKARLEVLRNANGKLNEKIKKLKEYLIETEEESVELDQKLAKYSMDSEKVLDAICKLCNLGNDEDYAESEFVVQPFKFRGSGHKFLDRVLTSLVGECIKGEDAASSATKPAPAQSKSRRPPRNFKDLTPKKVSAIIAALAKKEQNGAVDAVLRHHKTNRIIDGKGVFEALQTAISRWRAIVFNRQVVPKYTDNGERNPALPNDPELTARFKQFGGKLLDEKVRDFAGQFEQEKRDAGEQVERDAHDNDVVEPSYSDDEYVDEEEGDDDAEEGVGEDFASSSRQASVNLGPEDSLGPGDSLGSGDSLGPGDSFGTGDPAGGDVSVKGAASSTTVADLADHQAKVSIDENNGMDIDNSSDSEFNADDLIDHMML